MQVLLYKDLDPGSIPNFAKLRRFLEAGDFRSAEVKKVGAGLYRARLDDSNRLLFTVRSFAGERYALVLELIANHAYDKSRFLGHGAVIDETKIPPVSSPEAAEAPPLAYVNRNHSRFHVLDKIICFDEQQDEVYSTPPPLIIIGSAGSGKTVLTLEKMKQAPGEVLYVTRSAYLVQNAHSLYYAFGYENEAQSVDFLSFQELLESIAVPEGREMTLRDFTAWHARQPVPRALRDPHQLFEEFKGVLTGATTEAPYMSREQYLGLGVKQSIFLPEERPAVYEMFTRYLQYMRDNGFYDVNIVSHSHLRRAAPRYDFAVVDEVQDLTNVQLRLVLALLRDPAAFVLSGDSNQIVHPNFFSWARLKSFFYHRESRQGPADIIRVLHTNYRNTPQVTELANRILKLKHARFGSIDRESNYLVRSSSERPGSVLLLRDSEALRRELDEKTRYSTHFALIVMHPEQKAEAREHFHTPLVFSIQEAKGLEYESVILYNFASGDCERYAEIARGVSTADIARDELAYGRARDKTDKSLEIYKFHINALYVAVTRAVANVYLLERQPEQPLFEVLGLEVAEGANIESRRSSLEEWRAEAHRLELQGKAEQAEEIRSRILQVQAVPWTPLTPARLPELEQKALAGDRTARLLLFEYALVHNDQNRIALLARAGFAPNLEKSRKVLEQKHFVAYESRNPAAMLRLVDRYGADFRDIFNRTPLMNATRLGNEPLVERLIAEGAQREAIDNNGFNAFRIALEQATRDPRYARQRLGALYLRLVPEDESLQVDGRLVKLDNRSMEFLLVNLMMAMFYSRLGRKVIYGAAFEASDFVDVLTHFPDAVVPQRRKQRPYISSVLAKNEVRREDRYNRKLFVRVRRGHYILNPALRLRVGEGWCELHDVLDLERVGYHDAGSLHEGEVLRRERLLALFRLDVRRLRERLLLAPGAAAEVPELESEEVF